MANSAEIIKKRYGNPFAVEKALEKAAREGYESLSEDDLFMCKWVGLYEHRWRDIHPEQKGYFMLRTKQINGIATPEQLDTVADIAEKQNKDFADITTRQDFQFHWVHYKDAWSVLQRLREVGISTLGACGDIPRNVCGCPVAGVDKEEIVNASPYAQQISDFFLGNPEYADLPRKYKISISGCKTQCIHPEIQCVGLVAIPRQASGKTEIGFDLRVGGGLSSQPFVSQRLGAFVRPDEVVGVVKHITEIWRDTPEYRAQRHRARIKFLVHDWGVAKLRAEIEERLGRKLEDSPADYQLPPETYRDHIGVHAQKQPGLFYVGAPVLIGRITSKQLHKVADLSRRYGDGKTIRLTNRQNILLLNIPEANVEKVLNGLAEVELSVNAHPIRRSMVTCTGIQFCRLAFSETKNRAQQIVEHIERRVPMDEPLRINMNGCPNGCAQYQIGHIGFMGSKTKVEGQLVEAYDIFLGGKLGDGARFNHAVVRRVPATECAKRLESLLLTYRKRRKGKETFNDWCDRVGDAELAKILSEGNAHPLAVDDVPMPKVPETDGPVFA